MDVPTLLERINHKHGTDLKLRRYAQGENQGAYAVEDASGALLVLKWQATTAMLSRVERARLVTERLVTLGVPAPRYGLVDTFPEGTTYWLQTALPGDPPAGLHLSFEHAQQLLELNERQAGQAVSAEQDWSTRCASLRPRHAPCWDGSSASRRAEKLACRAQATSCTAIWRSATCLSSGNR